MTTWIAVAVAVAVPALVAAWVGGAAALDRYGRRAVPRRSYDALVVAGCRVHVDGRPSAALVRRVALAADLYHRGVSRRIVLTGGRSPDTPVSEARAAAVICARLGVPDEHLVLEEASRTTLENAAFAAALVTGEVLVVSDAAHAFRCRRVFRRHFVVVDVVGTIPPRGPRVRLALREALAVVRHAVLGNLH